MMFPPPGSSMSSRWLVMYRPSPVRWTSLVFMTSVPAIRLMREDLPAPDGAVDDRRRRAEAHRDPVANGWEAVLSQLARCDCAAPAGGVRDLVFRAEIGGDPRGR